MFSLHFGYNLTDFSVIFWLSIQSFSGQLIIIDRELAYFDDLKSYCFLKNKVKNLLQDYQSCLIIQCLKLIYRWFKVLHHYLIVLINFYKTKVVWWKSMTKLAYHISYCHTDISTRWNFALQRWFSLPH